MPNFSKLEYETLSMLELKKLTKRGDIRLISEATGFSYEYVRSVLGGNRARKSEKIRKALIQLLIDREQTLRNIKNASDNG